MEGGVVDRLNIGVVQLDLDEEQEGLSFLPNGGAPPAEINLHTWTIAGRFLTDNVIKFDIMQRVMAAAWKPALGVRIVQKDDNLYLFHFFHMKDATRIIEEGPWSFDNATLVMKLLSPGEVVEAKDLNMVQMWVQIYDLPDGYTSLEILEAVELEPEEYPFDASLRAGGRKKDTSYGLQWLRFDNPSLGEGGGFWVPGPPRAMSIISWNCRGLGNLRIVQEVAELVFAKKPDFVFLMETKGARDKAEVLRVKIGFEGLFVVDSVGASGGLALLWRSNRSVNLISYSRFHVDVMVSLEGALPWRLTGFYGNPRRDLRQTSWDLLRSLKVRSSLPWVVIGDFNAVCASSEKRGGQPQPLSLISAFNSTLAECRLFDLGMQGYPFTWERGRGTENWVEERLDRAVSTCEWRVLHPHACVINHPMRTSDHSALFLCLTKPCTQRRMKQFRFENAWLCDDGYKDVIKESWNSSSTRSLHDRLGYCGAAQSTFFDQITPKVSPVHNDMLLRPFEEVEVRKASPDEAGAVRDCLVEYERISGQSIMAAQELVKAGVRRRIGNGVETMAWGTPWLLDRDNPFLHTVLASPSANLPVQMIPCCPRRKDNWFWIGSEDDLYSVKSGYRRIMGEATQTPGFSQWSRLWRIPVAPKVKVCVWRALRGILPTVSALNSKGLEIDNCCSICGQLSEAVDHLFLRCPFAEYVWKRSSFQVANRSAASSFSDWVQLVFQTATSSELIHIVWTIWMIWKCRNAAVWEQRVPTPEVTVRMVLNFSKGWENSHREDPPTLTPSAERVFPPEAAHCFFDAALFHASGLVGAGGVIFSSSKEFQAAFARRLWCPQDPLLAEAMACRETLSWLKSLGV
ncbi:unnamed protein product [Cuscuta campestris]|uniref:Reverse transcriptase zinc-binding domain-containing protein n=1 Tax=Cuscuta campestris TaxID=132261 RepID=A0A484K4A2_9ASTE|nr:unnamed protein product [Cuscuta campestris]